MQGVPCPQESLCRAGFAPTSICKGEQAPAVPARPLCNPQHCSKHRDCSGALLCLWEKLFEGISRVA